MSRICTEIRMELLSDAIFSSGSSVPGGSDISLRLDAEGKPFVPGSTLKGLFRESLTNYLCWTGTYSEETVGALLGHSGENSIETGRRLIFEDLHPENTDDMETWSYPRTFTKLSDGVIETGTLRMADCLRQGLVFTGFLFCDEADFSLVENSAKAIQWVGLMRNRGFGQVQFTVDRKAEIGSVAILPPGNWLHYRLRLRTPLIVSAPVNGRDDTRNYVESRSYLPGSAVRGMIISRLAQQKPEWFEAHKEKLLRQTFFLNALPAADGDPLIPFPMGFYEDKGKTRFYSVLNRDVEAGDKRARLGGYCSLEGDTIYPYSLKMETALRIQRDRNNQQMFVVSGIAAETELEGYIRTEDASLLPDISAAFQEWVHLGAYRYAGNGLCHVEALDAQEPQYGKYGYAAGQTSSKTLYMLLLSPTAMICRGEPVGLDEEQLTHALGVETVQIQRCSSSLTRVESFNRTLGCYTPSVQMYETGSVFCLACSEAPSVESIRALERDGIGIRREEGYGRVLFLRDFAALKGYARPEEQEYLPSEEVLRRQAKCKWLLAHPLPSGLSRSQLGTVRGLCEQILLGDRPWEELDTFFEHNLERGARYADKYERLKHAVEQILGRHLWETVACEHYDDTREERLQLICDWIALGSKED